MEPNETMLATLRRHLDATLAGFSTRERALADAITRAFYNAAEEAPESVTTDGRADVGISAPSVPGSAA